MVLAEKEIKVLKYLRHLSFPVNQNVREHESPVDDLSNDELISLYNKMDDIIEEEGTLRRSLGSLDEIYRLELRRVKDILSQECKKRHYTERCY